MEVACLVVCIYTCALVYLHHNAITPIKMPVSSGVSVLSFVYFKRLAAETLRIMLKLESLNIEQQFVFLKLLHM